MENISSHIVDHNISIIIPVFNSSGTLFTLNERLNKTLIKTISDYEIIYVNDGSIDDSDKVLIKLKKDNKNIKYISLAKNYGQHNAILCGIREAQFDTIVTLDDDLQNPPEKIPILLNKLNEGYDVVYGYPTKEKHNYFRNVASTFTKLALKASMGIENADQVSSFRIFKTRLRDAFCGYKGSFISIDVLLSWGTNSFSAIPIEFEKRKDGKSNYTFRKLVQHALNMVTGFSILPLQIASVIGIVLALFGLFVLIYVAGRFFLQGSPVPGFPFLASIISIFSGAQLLAIGIIGEYLARQHFRMLGIPQYFKKKADK